MKGVIPGMKCEECGKDVPHLINGVCDECDKKARARPPAVPSVSQS